MKFRSSRAGGPLSLAEASLLGYPGDEGFFLPSGEADLRATVYAPSSGFGDTLALSLVELLADELDPPSILKLAAGCFAREPEAHHLDEDILVLDLAQGPSASSHDYAASFSAAFLSRLAEPGRDFFLAAASGREASALAEAFGNSDPGLPLVILRPAATAGKGIPESSLRRAGGRVILVDVGGSLSDCARLERLAAKPGQTSLVGLPGRKAIPCGGLSPAYLLGRSLLFVGLFAIARRGLSGDLIVTAPPADILGLVTGLWAWSWGIPVTSFLLPRHAGEPDSALFPFLAAESGNAEEVRGAEFLASFNREYPLPSLVMSREIDDEGEQASRILPDGLILDPSSSLAMAAAKSALAAGLAGHARIVVPRFADPRARTVPAAADAVIQPSLGGLASALSGLL